MTRARTIWIAAAAGVVAAIVGVGVIMAQTPGSTPTDTPSTPSASDATPGGTFKSNEDATHEANEPADRETAENNGTFMHGKGHGGGSNEDPTHEASEPAARESQEAPGTAPSAATVTPSGTTL